MSSVKPKSRKKIKYIGKPLTASEILAHYDIKPEVIEEAHRMVDEYFAQKHSRRPVKKNTARNKAAVAK